MVIADSQTISLTEEWINVFLHDDRQQLGLAREKAMNQPELYKQLIEDFGNRQLPLLEKLAQQLHINPKYNILKDAAMVAAKTFYESASYALMLDNLGFLKTRNNTVPSVEQSDDKSKEPNNNPVQEPIREVNAGQVEQVMANSPAPPPPPNQADIVMQPIQLENDLMMYIYGPRRLLPKDKERIKQYIDLWLEERAGSSTAITTIETTRLDN